MRITRFLATIVAMAAMGLAVAAQSRPAATPATKVTVYKTASCGCCKLWVEHLKASGFDVQAMDVSAEQVRSVSKAAGLKDDDVSCHTAKVGAYTIEGHVPAADIHRLLKDPGKLKGIAVPGMPVGSPGMEQGSRRARRTRDVPTHSSSSPTPRSRLASNHAAEPTLRHSASSNAAAFVRGPRPLALRTSSW